MISCQVRLATYAPKAYFYTAVLIYNFFCIYILGEARGIGGIFFDDLDEGKHEKMFEFVTVSEHNTQAK